jgi:tetratricopeptide (TPR) repeat protein
MLLRVFVIICLGLLVACRREQAAPAEDPKKNMAEAQKYIGENQPQEAIKILEKCLSSGDNTSEAAELLAAACLLNGDGELAAFYFEQAASSSELKYYCYLKAAEIYEQLKDFSRAILCYRCYLDALPEDDEIQVKYAGALARDGQRKKALTILVPHAQDHAAVHSQIAELFSAFGNYTQARNWYRSALRCEKNNRAALEGLWTVSLGLRDWEALREVGATLLDLGVKSAGGVDVAEFVEKLKVKQRTLAVLRNAELRFDRVILPMFSSEQTPSNSHKTPPTIPQQTPPMPPKTAKNEKMERIENWRIEAREAKGRGDFDGAIAVLWKILGADGKNVDAWVDLTDCLLKINKYDIAEMAIQEAIKFSPKRVDLHLTYLDIVLRTRNSADYMHILQGEKRKFPGSAEVRLLWARAQEIYKEDAVGAKRSYEKFLQLAPPGHPEIQKIRHLLEVYGSKE